MDGSEAVMKLIIQNGKGEKRERKIAMVTKLFDNGKTEKRVYRFLSPADVKGTGVLAFDYENKGDDMWIYLPALRKTRRIVTSERSKAFMGSEFSYADMNTPTLTDYTFRTLKEEAVDGVSCWLIEVKPKNEDVAEDEGYSKKKIWIAKEEYTIRKALYFDLEGELLKELKSKNIECLDELKKRYRSKYMEMTNKQNGRKSIFKIEKIENIPNTKDLYFTTEYLERP
ncbi:MAG: outer membrane lipoprotein-sorting protein [Deltaproteobacteria bacterium]|nr:outer membrane lipoprotein-sorting protein [Deltaproteobacteria bacterium]MBN2670969.1 outer membrane lipoprotein-sorting protein [Deltaproteobacteria bacterium]